jgi:hypothetical protein
MPYYTAACEGMERKCELPVGIQALNGISRNQPGGRKDNYQEKFQKNVLQFCSNKREWEIIQMKKYSKEISGEGGQQ